MPSLSSTATALSGIAGAIGSAAEIIKTDIVLRINKNETINTVIFFILNFPF